MEWREIWWERLSVWHDVIDTGGHRALLRVLFNAVSNISHMVSGLSRRQTGTHIKQRAWTLAALHNDTFRGLEPLIKAKMWKGGADREESRRKANEMESSRLSGKECGSVLPLVHVCTCLWGGGGDVVGLTYIIPNCYMHTIILIKTHCFILMPSAVLIYQTNKSPYMHVGHCTYTPVFCVKSTKSRGERSNKHPKMGGFLMLIVIPMHPQFCLIQSFGAHWWHWVTSSMSILGNGWELMVCVKDG